MILVTGGTGLVGAHLLWDLTTQMDVPIRATYRTKSSMDPVLKLFRWKAELANRKTDATGLFDKIEWVKADIKDIPALTLAFKQVTHVYHCAAFISFNPKRFDYLQKTNVEGTANMVNLSLLSGVKKFCMVSSVAALGNTADGSLIDEDTQWEPSKENSVYSISKFASEMEVWRGTQENLEVVIINPAIILGEGFYNTGSGLFFKHVAKGSPYIVSGSSGFVDVQDVTKAMVALMNSAVKNERFIAVGINATFKEIFTGIAQALNSKPPHKIIKPWQLEVAWRVDWFLNTFLGKKQKLFRSTAKSASTKTSYSNAKLINELGFSFTPIDETLKRIAIHFLQNKVKE